MKSIATILFIVSYCAVSFPQSTPPLLVPVLQNGKWGYSDTSGVMQIPAVFDWATCFTNESAHSTPDLETWYAEVKIGDFCNWIDVQGRQLWHYDQIHSVTLSPLTPALKRVSITVGGAHRKLSALVNNRLQVLRPFAPEEILPNDAYPAQAAGLPVYSWNNINYGEHFLIKTNETRLLGLIDTSGKTLVEPVYEQLSNLYEGKYLALKPGGNQWFLYALPAVVLDSFPYGAGSGIQEGLVKACRYEDGITQCGFVDLQKHVVIPFKYHEVYGFYRGMAAGRRTDGAWELFDKTGKTLALVNDPSGIISYPEHVFIRKDSAHWNALDTQFKPFPLKNFAGPPQQLQYKGKAYYRFLLDQDSVYTDLKGNILGRHAYSAIILAKGSYIPSTNGWQKLDKLFYVRKAEKWGMAIQKAPYHYIELLPPQLDAMPSVHDGLVFGKKNGRWGVTDTLGHEIIPFQYDKAISFYNPWDSTIKVSLKGRYGIFDRKGKQLTPFFAGSYGRQFNLEGNIIEMDTMGNMTYLCNRKGLCKTFDSSYQVAPLFFPGFDIKQSGKPAFSVRKNNLEGLLDFHLEWILPPRYLYCDITDDGKYTTRADADGYVLMERPSGKILHTCGSDDRLSVHGNQIVKIERNPNAVLDSSGNWISPLRFSIWIPEKQAFMLLPENAFYMEGFHENTMRFADEQGKIGFLDKNLAVIIPARYDDAERFQHGASIVKKNGKNGVISKTGVEIVAPEYTFVRRLGGHYFSICKDSIGLCSLLDNSGNLLYKDAQHFALLPGGTFRVWPADMSDNKYDLIDSTGKNLVTDISACYAGTSGVAYIKDGIYDEVGRTATAPYRVIFEIGKATPYNDSLIWTGIVTGGTCYEEFGIEGILRKDGTAFIPIGEHAISQIKQTGDFQVYAHNETVLYDAQGHPTTGFDFGTHFQFSRQAPYCYLFEKPDKSVWWITRHGRVLGCVKP